MFSPTARPRQPTANETTTTRLNTDSHVETAPELAALIAEIGSARLLAAFDPAASAQAGKHPFYDGLYAGPLRRCLGRVDLRAVTAADGRTTPLGYGNAEIVEIISGLRSRTFDGVFCLWPLGAGDQEVFRHAAGSFWRIMDAI